jgi:hypothetical protein
VLDRRLEHVRIDEDGQHAQGFVLLDETHSAHVGREIVDLGRAACRDFAVLFQVEVETEIFDVVEALIPLVKRFYVDGTNRGTTASSQVRDQRPAYETTRTSYDD